MKYTEEMRRHDGITDGSDKCECHRCIKEKGLSVDFDE